MGMFDDIKCTYPLPVEGANALAYQTKDTPSQYLDKYEIRADGTLWVETYDTEDQSRVGVWMRENPGKELPQEIRDDNLAAFVGCMARINKRWVQVDKFSGVLDFYTNLGDPNSEHSGWIEWQALYDEGKLLRIKLIEHTPEGANSKNEP